MVSHPTWFLSLLKEAPHVAPLVVSLQMDVGRQSNHHEFVEILSYLTHVQHLGPMAFMDPNAFHWLGANESLCVHTFPKLRSSSLYTLGSLPLGWILPACSGLERLRVECTSVLPEDDTDGIGLPHPLQALEIETSSMVVVSTLVRALDRNRCNQIHSLVVTFPPGPLSDPILAFHPPFLRHVASTLTNLNLRGLA